MDYYTLKNSIWPNGVKRDEENYACFYPLGTKKVNIPTSSSEWPQGNKLISPFVYQNDKLVGFCDTKAMTANDNTTITMPYTYIEADFTSIKEGTITVNAPNATYKKFTWGSSANSGDTIVLGTKYLGCKTEDDIIAIDPNFRTNDIINGVWSQSLADYVDETDISMSGYLFYRCDNLTTFNSDLSSLVYGRYTFACCNNLTRFDASLHSLTYGIFMFDNCHKLTSFKSDLSSLTNGYMMFYNCKLDTASIVNIADVINDVTLLENDEHNCYEVWKAIHIGIGNSSPNTEEDAAFRLMAEKGWTVYVNVNGLDNPTYQPDNLATLDENDEAVSTPIPFYAKPVQTDEKRAHYVDDEGNYFNILGGHYIYGDDISSYGMFTSLEDAAANMRLTPYIKPQTENN